MSSTEQQTRLNSDSAPVGRGQTADNRPGAAKGSALKQMPPRKTWLWFLGVLLANYLLMRFLIPSPEAAVTVPYTLFKEEVSKGNVEAIYSQGESITGRFKAPVTYPAAGEKNAAPNGQSQTAGEKNAVPAGESPKASQRGAAPRGEPKTASTFATTLPTFVDPDLETFLIDNGVEISAKPIQEGDNPLATLLFGFGPAPALHRFLHLDVPADG